MTPKELQDLLDEPEASRVSRKRVWAILQEIRWVLKDVAGIEISPPARKTIDLEGRLVSFAERHPFRIVLIDGEQLAALMIRHNVGVRIDETLYLKKVDEDFFIDE